MAVPKNQRSGKLPPLIKAAYDYGKEKNYEAVHWLISVVKPNLPDEDGILAKAILCDPGDLPPKYLVPLAKRVYVYTPLPSLINIMLMITQVSRPALFRLISSTNSTTPSTCEIKSLPIIEPLIAIAPNPTKDMSTTTTNFARCIASCSLESISRLFSKT